MLHHDNKKAEEADPDVKTEINAAREAKAAGVSHPLLTFRETPFLEDLE